MGGDPRWRGGDERGRDRKWVHDRADNGNQQDHDSWGDNRYGGGRRNMRGGPMMGGGRDFGDRRGGVPDRRGGSRFPRRDEEAAPEWMTETIEQGDMMELRGFDDSPEKERPMHMKLEKRKEAAKTRTQPEPEVEDPAVVSAVPGKPPQSTGTASAATADCGFNLDDILHLESIPGLSNILADDSADISFDAGNDDEGGGGGGGRQDQGGTDRGGPRQGSRFIQLFQQREQDEQQKQGRDKNSRRSSIQEELNGGGGVNGGGGGQPQIRIPSPSDSHSFYFAPISPAAKTTSQQPNSNASNAAELQQQQQQGNSIMELLRGNAQGKLILHAWRTDL